MTSMNDVHQALVPVENWKDNGRLWNWCGLPCIILDTAYCRLMNIWLTDWLQIQHVRNTVWQWVPMNLGGGK